MVHGNKELLEKLGRNDLCPCDSGRRFQKLLLALWTLRRRATQPLPQKIILEPRDFLEVLLIQRQHLEVRERHDKTALGNA